MQEKTSNFQLLDRDRPIFLHLDLHKLHLKVEISQMRNK